MTETFRKLNFKSQSPILVLHAPDAFSGEISAMKGATEVHLKSKKNVKYPFAIAFVELREGMEKAGRELLAVLDDDPVCWFAYPKGTSKRYKSDLNRDSLREALAHLGLRAVRQIAIDEDWSALRFRVGE